MTRPFAPRTWDISKHTTQSLILSILASHLHMFRRSRHPPPFVHPLQINADAINDTMSISILSTCREHLSDYFVTPSPSKTSAWTHIQQHAEELWFTHESLSNWSLLASLQTLLFYTILRVTQPHLPDPSSDLPFLICINHVVRALIERVTCQCAQEIRASATMQHDHWVFFEARRRTIVVFRILSMLVDLSDAVPCVPLPDYAIVPLPMPEGLWGAVDQKEWKSWLEEVVCEEEVYGMTVKGELKKMDMVQEDTVLPKEAAWDEWCSGTGQIGMLIAAMGQVLN
jgi:hypothetical protein